MEDYLHWTPASNGNVPPNAVCGRVNEKGTEVWLAIKSGQIVWWSGSHSSTMSTPIVLGHKSHLCKWWLFYHLETHVAVVCSVVRHPPLGSSSLARPFLPPSPYWAGGATPPAVWCVERWLQTNNYPLLWGNKFSWYILWKIFYL